MQADFYILQVALGLQMICVQKSPAILIILTFVQTVY